MSWREALRAWWQGIRGPRGRAGPVPAEHARSPRPPLVLPLPAVETFTLLGPLPTFLDACRRRVAGWGWDAVASLPTWAGGRARGPAAGRARTQWPGFRKAAMRRLAPRLWRSAVRQLAFARGLAERYRYRADEGEPRLLLAPPRERAFPPWFGALEGVPGTAVPDWPFPGASRPVEWEMRGSPGEEEAREEVPLPGDVPWASPVGPGERAMWEALPSEERFARPAVTDVGRAGGSKAEGVQASQATGPRQTPRLRGGAGRADATEGPPRAPTQGLSPEPQEKGFVAGSALRGPKRSLLSRVRRFLERLSARPGIADVSTPPSLPQPGGATPPGRSPAQPQDRRAQAPSPAKARVRPMSRPSYPPPSLAEDLPAAVPHAVSWTSAGAPAAAEMASEQATGGPVQRTTDETQADVPGDRDVGTPEPGASPQVVGAGRQPLPVPGQLMARLGAGAPLPPATRQFLEGVLRRPLKGVRVHTGWEAGRITRALGAAAATLGDHILLSPGFPGVDTPRGMSLLAHEVVHARQAAERGPALEGAPEAREEEAEALRAQWAVQALSRVPVPPPAGPPFPDMPPRPSPPAATSGRAMMPPTPVIATPSSGPFRRAPAEETVAPSPPAPAPVAQPPLAPDVDALAEEVYRRLRYRLEIEREQRGLG